LEDEEELLDDASNLSARKEAPSIWDCLEEVEQLRMSARVEDTLDGEGNLCFVVDDYPGSAPAT
jgi:hypothetical protein